MLFMIIPQASTSSHGMLTLDLVAEEDGFSPDYDCDSWENSFKADLHGGGSCGQVALVGSQGVGVRQRADTDVSKLRITSKEPKVKTGSLPRGSERSWGKHSSLEASMVPKTQQVQVGKLNHPDPCGSKLVTVTHYDILLTHMIDFVFCTRHQRLNSTEVL